MYKGIVLIRVGRRKVYKAHIDLPNFNYSFSIFLSQDKAVRFARFVFTYDCITRQHIIKTDQFYICAATSDGSRPDNILKSFCLNWKSFKSESII